MTDALDYLDEITDDEEEEEVNLLEELQRQARNLNIVDIDGLGIDELNVKIMARIKAQTEGLRRLEFQQRTQPGKLELIDDDPTNIEILEIVPEEPNIQRQEVIEKLRGYILLEDKFATSNRRWIRYINVKDGLLRTGGFPIKNNRQDEFIVLKNVSKRFTLSIKRDDVIIFEKQPGDILPDNIQRLFNNILNQGKNIVIITNDLQNIYTGRTMTEAARNAGINRNSVSRAFKNNKKYVKKNYLFKMTDEELANVRQQIQGIQLGNNIPANVMAIINRFY